MHLPVPEQTNSTATVLMAVEIILIRYYIDMVKGAAGSNRFGGQPSECTY